MLPDAEANADADAVEGIVRLATESATEFASGFAAGLLDPSQPAPSFLVAEASGLHVKRYDVYRNNVTSSLIDAVRAIYPAVERITGPDFFRAMARQYVRSCPPAGPLLHDYGREFAVFIENYRYARDMPWLADVARIERAWLDAYHAQDHAVVQAGVLADLDPGMLGRLRLVAHPAARVLRSRYPAVTIFSANKQGGATIPVCSSAAEDCLVTRPEADVIVSSLPPGGAAFLQSLMQDRNLADAVAAALEDAPTFDLGANLAGAFSAGAFISFDIGCE
ncbi:MULTISPECIES: DUF2063 domain-containing protein [unclassified Achromobacter]|uniref:HvfC/BufC N-terminal domain-containing protein n=1 Tax=unclassified Achromobacter TaxID=2626865 RepID=UPI000B51BEE0|nr:MULTISPECIES: DNA-binding domain-containing protein [unclassified Achromobacter]OWT76920.1 DUF2063 domain-containing protein [Achromobacter sp. HZ28]OWT77800.1 DUF2063 domain-containing protein [Achromobacter sp. HZ34]